MSIESNTDDPALPPVVGSGSSDVDIQCPNGCNGLCSLSICGLCGNTGWVSAARAEDHARRQARKPITLEANRAGRALDLRFPVIPHCARCNLLDIDY